MHVEVRWRVSQSASCFHAAEAICRQRRTIVDHLDAALREGAEQLHRQAVEAGVPEDDFWDHLVPLAAEIESNRELIDVALRKAAGLGRYSELLVNALACRVAQIEAAGQRAVPDLVEQLSQASEPLRQQWERCGLGLLNRVALLTDERMIVGQMTVDLVYPALGGGGVAHLRYNTARIEALECDPDPMLPEVVRLAWLVAQLNMDLPVFTESVPRRRLGLIAQLAVLPVVLKAAEELELVASGSSSSSRAIELWGLERGDRAELTDVLASWWESYLEMRPAWAVALAALDQMIGTAFAC
jgi:hypothetical protein